ncbi:MAG: aldo/keto reductase [Alphaproteobacteria bacterium]
MADKKPKIRIIETRDGMRMPALGIGTWRMGERAGQKKDEIASIRLAMDLGVTLIDTAEMYGDAETVVGEAIKGRRDGLFIVSKVLPSNASRKGTIQAAERSLKKLGIDCMDLYLLHWEGSYPLEETLEAFESLRKAGKIKHHGVSNFDTRAMADAEGLKAGQKIASNQVMYNLTRRGIERNLLPWCRKHKVAVMAYSPLDQGSLKSTGALASVARRHAVAPETIAIAWTMRDPWVASIPKTSNPAHVRANVAAAGIALTPEDLAELDSAYPPPKRDVPLDIV